MQVQEPDSTIGLARKFICFFCHEMVLVVLVFNFTQNNFVALYCDRCHLSVHQKNIEFGDFFCSHFNIEDGRKEQHFGRIMLYYFKKGKNAIGTHKKICVVYGEGAVTDQTCQKWFVKFCAGDFSLADAPWLHHGGPLKLIVIKLRH